MQSKDELKASVGTHIRQYRQQLGYTQEALAELVGVSVPYLCQIEGGKRFAHIYSLCRIADALHKPLDAIVSGDSRDTTYEQIASLLQNCSSEQITRILGLLIVLSAEQWSDANNIKTVLE